MGDFFSINRILESEIMREIAIESFKWFLILGSFVALVIGIILFIRPDVVQRVNKALNKWYSARKKMKPLEIMRDTDDYFYRNNKILGWILLIGSVICLYVFAFDFRVEFSEFYGTEVELFQALVLQTLKVFFIIFMIIGIPVWILLIFAPERLKTVSHFFNRWISTRLMLLPLEQMHYEFDSFVFKHPRFFGVVFVLGSVLILFSFIIAT